MPSSAEVYLQRLSEDGLEVSTLPSVDVSSMPPGSYLGGETLTPNGNSTACTIPAGTNTVILAANGGDVYYSINPGAGAASATSPGFIAQGQHWLLGPISNLTSLKVFSAAGATKAHIEYYSY